MVVSKTYSGPGSYSVTLTVADDRGGSASTTQTITVSDSVTPTAVILFSPQNPAEDQTIFFDGTTSTAPTGRSIVSYVWNFGDGPPLASGDKPEHSYSTAGTYVVRLRVTDSSGAEASTTVQVEVGSADPTASFTVSPDPAPSGATVTVDASASTAVGGATIATYFWNFGSADATPLTTLCPGGAGCGAGGSTAAVVYTPPMASLPVTLTITLTVTDDATPPRTDSTTRTVTIE